jgi:hypothetical protein
MERFISQNQESVITIMLNLIISNRYSVLNEENVPKVDRIDPRMPNLCIHVKNL